MKRTLREMLLIDGRPISAEHTMLIGVFALLAIPFLLVALPCWALTYAVGRFVRFLLR